MSLLAMNMSAWTYTATGPWASFSFSDGWTVYQNAWGAPNDQSPVLYANSSSNFACYVNYTGGGVKNYCHVQKDADIPISSNYYCTASFNVSAPDNPWWNFMFDVWTADMQDELIISQTWRGDAIWGNLVASNVTIGGRMFKEVRQAHNGYNNVLIFTPATQRTSGTEDIMAFFIWALNRGLLHNSTLHQISFGVEVTYTSGWQQFTVNSFSCSWGTKSSSGTVRIQNKATGLYLDGMGRTSNGSNVGQWGNSGSTNQQWIMEASGSYVRFKNVATGLYLDGMYWSSNGSDCGQWSNSGSDAQQWTIITSSSKGDIIEDLDEVETVTAINNTTEDFNVQLFPNPFNSEINLKLSKPDEINRILIYDFMGKQVQTIEKSKISSSMTLGYSLQSGVYIVRINGSNYSKSFKVIKY